MTMWTRRGVLLAAGSTAAIAFLPSTGAQAMPFRNGRPKRWKPPFKGSRYFNRPAKRFDPHPQSNALVEALWYEGTASRPGNFNCFDRAYTYPVFFADVAEDLYTVHASSGNMDGERIPWSPSWQIPAGSDCQFVVLDWRHDTQWNAWRASVDHATRTLTCSRCNCVNVENTEAFLGTPLSWKKSDGVFSPSRGCGLSYLALLVVPEEIARGSIKHALSVPTRSAQNTFVEPASKSDGTSGGSIPEGTHYFLDVTNRQIKDAVAALPSDIRPELRRFAKIVYKALKKYGFYITDSSGGAHFQFEANESAGPLWEDLGVWPPQTSRQDGKEYPRDILDHIMSPNCLKALAPRS